MMKQFKRHKEKPGSCKDSYFLEQRDSLKPIRFEVSKLDQKKNIGRVDFKASKLVPAEYDGIEENSVEKQLQNDAV